VTVRYNESRPQAFTLYQTIIVKKLSVCNAF